MNFKIKKLLINFYQLGDMRFIYELAYINEFEIL